MEGATGTGGGSGYLTPIMNRPTQNIGDADPRRGAESDLKVRQKGNWGIKKRGGFEKERNKIMIGRG